LMMIFDGCVWTGCTSCSLPSPVGSFSKHLESLVLSLHGRSDSSAANNALEIMLLRTHICQHFLQCPNQGVIWQLLPIWQTMISFLSASLLVIDLSFDNFASGAPCL
jgi:hypothetical protein